MTRDQYFHYKFSGLWSFFIFCGLGVVFFGQVLDASGRAASWKPENRPGSNGFPLQETRSIHLPEGAELVLRLAAEDLAGVFGRRFEHRPEIVLGEARARKPVIVFEHLLKRPRGWEEGGFILVQTGSVLRIRAMDTEGWVNGTYGFAGTVLGARWYWPGELGEELVGAVPERYLERPWWSVPAFSMRVFHPVETEYGRRNRLVRRFHLNHNLARVFSKEVFEESPELFAEIRGRRRVPRGSGAVDPQPDFTQVKAVEIAAAAALHHFEETPESRSFSLSINDNALFDEGSATEAAVSPVTYFRGRPNYTDLVFRFMNEVADLVFEEGGAWETPSGAPRYLTALAYYWTEPSPSFPLHPRVMPILTSDRAQWHDSHYREEDKALIERWSASGAERVATWDYYFGAPYPYPRQFNQWMIESIQFMAEAGVSAFYSQLPSAWGLDGGKAWVAASLLWDPKQDGAALLDEYYSNFFGAGGPWMRRFYEAAEAHRNAHEGKADWIKFYKDESGIELFPEAKLVEMRQFIESAAVVLAGDDRRLERVDVVSAAFRLTELYAAFHRARVRMVEQALFVLGGAEANETEAAERLNKNLREYRKLWVDYEAYANDLVEKAEHQRLASFVRMRQSEPEGLALAALARGGVSVPADVEGSTDSALWLASARYAQVPDLFRSILPNPGFEDDGREPKRISFLGPELPSVAGWYFDFRPSEALSVKTQAGEGLVIEGADAFSVFYDVSVRPGQIYLLDAELAWKVSPDNRSQIRLTWTDANGVRKATEDVLRLPTGEWHAPQKIWIPFKVPELAVSLRLHFIVSRQYGGDYLQLRRANLKQAPTF